MKWNLADEWPQKGAKSHKKDMLNTCLISVFANLADQQGDIGDSVQGLLFLCVLVPFCGYLSCIF